MAYVPGEQPDPDFVKFFNGDWQRLLETVEIPGMTGASWDRRAAYLFWVLDRWGAQGMSIAEALAEEIRHAEPKPQALGNGRTWADVTAVPVGNQDQKQSVKVNAEAEPINLYEIAACRDFPEGVISGFDSAKFKW